MKAYLQKAAATPLFFNLISDFVTDALSKPDRDSQVAALCEHFVINQTIPPLLTPTLVYLILEQHGQVDIFSDFFQQLIETQPALELSATAYRRILDEHDLLPSIRAQQIHEATNEISFLELAFFAAVAGKQSLCEAMMAIEPNTTRLIAKGAAMRADHDWCETLLMDHPKIISSIAEAAAILGDKTWCNALVKRATTTWELKAECWSAIALAAALTNNRSWCEEILTTLEKRRMDILVGFDIGIGRTDAEWRKKITSEHTHLCKQIWRHFAIGAANRGDMAWCDEITSREPETRPVVARYAGLHANSLWCNAFMDNYADEANYQEIISNLAGGALTSAAQSRTADSSAHSILLTILTRFSEQSGFQLMVDKLRLEAVSDAKKETLTNTLESIS